MLYKHPDPNIQYMTIILMFYMIVVIYRNARLQPPKEIVIAVLLKYGMVMN